MMRDAIYALTYLTLTVSLAWSIAPIGGSRWSWSVFSVLAMVSWAMRQQTTRADVGTSASKGSTDEAIPTPEAPDDS